MRGQQIQGALKRCPAGADQVSSVRMQEGVSDSRNGMDKGSSDLPMSSLPPVASKRGRRQDSCYTWAAKEGRERRITHLTKLGWRKDGPDWFSPYTGTRFTLQTALDVEDLRQTFTQGWYERSLDDDE